MSSKPVLVIVGGPTAVGKTVVAIKIALHFNTEIVSADSRQFYQEMRIGTAVPGSDELSAVKHHFIQNRSVEQPFNASSYENDAIQLIDNLFQTKNILVLVGGSGLYIDAVCNGIDDLPSIPADVRNKFNQIFEEEGIEKIRELLKSVDPIYFSQVDINNHKRMLKALEVFEIMGKPYSSFLSNPEKQRNFKTVKIFLDTERTELYNRINYRVDTMIVNGLEEEARSLLSYRKLTPLNTVGYKEFFEHFDGTISRDEAITQIKNHTRAYARRQLTWFRRYTDAHWYTPDQIPDMIELISKSI